MSFVQMDSLDRIIQKWDAAQLIDFPGKPTEPVFRPPEASPPYNKLGELLGMESGELEIIIHQALWDPTPSVLTAWKNFLFVAKLNATEELMKYQTYLATKRTEFKNEQRNYQIRLEQFEGANRKRLAEQGGLYDQLRNRWNKLIKSLLVAIERFPTTKELSEEDAIAVGVLRNYGLAHIDDEGRVILEVSALSVLDTETIVEICQLVKSFIEPLRPQVQSP